jgi:hypothetical protein
MSIQLEKSARVGTWLGLMGLSAAMGASVVVAPFYASIVAAAAILLLLLSTPAYYWAIAALIAATLFRPFTALGLAPGYINFFHFPLALFSAVLACTMKSRWDQTARKMGIGMLALLLLSLLSWVANQGEVGRPILNWLVFCEPFLVLFTILKSDLTPGLYRASWRLVLGIALVQFPVGIWQAFNVGLSDDLQGTFVGQGAGAHVAGAVCLLGVLICATRGTTNRSFRGKWVWFVMAAALFSIPLLADANQAIVAGILGLGMALITCTAISPARLVLPATVMACVVYIGYSLYTPLQRISNSELMHDGLEGKIAGMNAVFSGMWHSPMGGLFGVGPGNSVSRVALLTSEADVKQGSPVGLLGLRTAPVTSAVLSITASNYLWKSSSVWSAVSSWLGLFGDLGPLGLAIYLWMILQLWCGIGGRRDWESSVSKGAILMAGFLGGIYSWLEEPGYTLMIGLIIGLTIQKSRLESKIALRGSEKVRIPEWTSRPAAWPASN